MSSLFSGKSKSGASSTASSLKGKDAPPPTHDIFTSPADGCVPKKKWDYSEEQLKQIDELKEYTSTLILPDSDAYHPWEARFLSDPGTHPRYMRAAKWKMDDAKRRIKGTMEWRREYKPELIEPGDVGIEAETGKIILTGFDYDARPILYMRPGRENTETSPRQIRHLIYNLERAIDFMPPGQEQVAIIVDYKSATSQSNPSIGTARKVLNILQNHYVERLGRGLVTNMPWWINAFFSGITPFMDPITRDKIRFNPKLVELVPASQLDYEFGGDYHLDYKFEPYWKTLTEFCHIAPNGSRIDNDGKPWYPPSGNGIKAAADGLMPTADAVATGEVTKDPAQAMPNGAAEKAAGDGATGVAEAATAPTAMRRQPSEAQKIAANHRQSVEIQDAPTPAYQSGEAEKDGGGVAAAEQGVAGMGLNSSGEKGPEIAGEKQAGPVGDGVVIPEPKAATTIPGPPEGDVAFDHPPTEEEKAEVRASLDVGR